MKLIPTMMTAWLTVLSGMVQAQQPPTPMLHRISAQQAVELALKQRAEMLNSKLDVKNQEAYNREITGSAYPQIAGNLGLQGNFSIPVTVLPDFISPTVYNVLETEGVKDANGNPIKFDGVINTFPAQFGLPWQASVGVGVQQLLFQPDVFIGLKARDAALELYKKQLVTTEQGVKKSVYEAYFGVLIAERGLGFAKESQDRLVKLFKDQQQLFANGFIEKLDLEKTSVSLNNVKSTVIRLNNLVSQSYAGLKMSMGFLQVDSLVLTDSLTVEMLNKDVLDMGADFKFDNRPEIQTLQTRNELLDLQVRRYKMQAYPTVAAFWNMQTNAQRQRFNFFDTKDRWFFSNVAGLSVSVPLTDGGQRRARIRQADIALEQNRNTQRQLEQSIDFEVVSARTQLVNAIEALNNQVENKTLAEKVYATTKIKYEQGLGSSFEVLQTETSLQDALNNYYQAMYGAVVARINYQKALGKL